ncbi:hypothetical protein PAPYR_9577 [Paratrimastix pyriformis]|uniref:Uncharacterized protein n=1 Tax=Paratrimastix pyriformis TaxID=342808 RepID=A0ABQ8UDP3_9EUKA|nr:hypothetical protein PAPYR_9577 [Paratrimastix pyriformis]
MPTNVIQRQRKGRDTFGGPANVRSYRVKKRRNQQKVYWEFLNLSHQFQQSFHPFCHTLTSHAQAATQIPEGSAPQAMMLPDAQPGAQIPLSELATFAPVDSIRTNDEATVTATLPLYPSVSIGNVELALPAPAPIEAGSNILERIDLQELPAAYVNPVLADLPAEDQAFRQSLHMAHDQDLYSLIAAYRQSLLEWEESLGVVTKLRTHNHAIFGEIWKPSVVKQSLISPCECGQPVSCTHSYETMAMDRTHLELLDQATTETRAFINHVCNYSNHVRLVAVMVMVGGEPDMDEIAQMSCATPLLAYSLTPCSTAWRPVYPEGAAASAQLEQLQLHLSVLFHFERTSHSHPRPSGAVPAGEYLLEEGDLRLLEQVPFEASSRSSAHLRPSPSPDLGAITMALSVMSTTIGLLVRALPRMQAWLRSQFHMQLVLAPWNNTRLAPWTEELHGRIFLAELTCNFRKALCVSWFCCGWVRSCESWAGWSNTGPSLARPALVPFSLYPCPLVPLSCRSSLIWNSLAWAVSVYGGGWAGRLHVCSRPQQALLSPQGRAILQRAVDVLITKLVSGLEETRRAEVLWVLSSGPLWVLTVRPFGWALFAILYGGAWDDRYAARGVGLSERINALADWRPDAEDAPLREAFVRSLVENAHAAHFRMQNRALFFHPCDGFTWFLAMFLPFFWVEFHFAVICWVEFQFLPFCWVDFQNWYQFSW